MTGDTVQPYNREFGSVEGFVGELRQQAYVSTPGNDPRIRSFCEAMLDEVGKSESARDLLSEVFDIKASKGPFPPSYQVNYMLRLFQTAIMPRDSRALGFKDDLPIESATMMGLQARDDYPENFDEKAPWAEVIEAVFRNPRNCQDLLALSEIFTHVQSVVADRYAGPLIEASVLLGTDDIEVLDVGCSRNHGLPWLVSPGLRQPVEIYKSTEYGEEVDRENTIYVNNLGALALGHSWGLDLHLIDDPFKALWQASCSAYPSELLNAARQDQYNALEIQREKLSNIHFTCGDIATPFPINYEPVLRNHPRRYISEALPAEQQFDCIINSTFWYQLSNEQKHLALEHEIARLKPGGLIVVQDYLIFDTEANPSDPIKQLIFPDKWFDKSVKYMSMVYLEGEEKKGFQPAVIFDNGRAKRAQLGRIILDQIPA